MKIWLLLIFLLGVLPVAAEDFPRQLIPLHSRGSQTLYVDTTIHGAGQNNLLVDTGSGHSVINKATLSRLVASGNAYFLRNLQGIMADGATRIVPLYRIPAITLGEGCVISDIEAAVFPDSARQILGISTLKKAAPFSFSFNPPMLSLSGCEQSISRIEPEQSMESTDLPLARQEINSAPADASPETSPSEG